MPETQTKRQPLAASPPEFRPGDLVRVGWKIKEGEKWRISYFDGIVLGIKGSGVSRNFLVRKIAAGAVGVERIFPLRSPLLVSVTVKNRGKPRRAKLYYLRRRIGKAAMRVG